MAELAVAGSAVGIVSLGIQVCKGLISYYDSWKGCHKDIANTVQTITTFSGILETVLAVVKRQEDKNAPLNKQIDDIVSQCNKNIDALSIELMKFEPYPQTAELRTKIKSHLRTTYYPFREGTLTGLRDNVQEARSNLVPALQALLLDKSLDIKADTQDNKALLASQLDKLGILERGTQDVNASLTSIGNGELPEVVELLFRWLIPRTY